MISLDTILVLVTVLGAATYLGFHYYKKWKSPKACGSGSCGCGQAGSKVFKKDKSIH